MSGEYWETREGPSVWHQSVFTNNPQLLIAELPSLVETTYSGCFQLFFSNISQTSVNFLQSSIRQPWPLPRCCPLNQKALYWNLLQAHTCQKWGFPFLWQYFRSRSEETILSVTTQNRIECWFQWHTACSIWYNFVGFVDIWNCTKDSDTYCILYGNHVCSQLECFQHSFWH